MKISANNIRIGNILNYKNDLWQVTKNPDHTKPGKGGAYVQVEMKNLYTGTKLYQRFSSSDNVDKAFVVRKTMQYLYPENRYLVLMDLQSFEQIMIDKKLLIGKQLSLLTSGMSLEVESYNDTPFNIILPVSLIVEIAETDPVIKTATVNPSYKPALLTNGLKIMVPMYLSIGDKIVIKSNELTFIEKVK